MAIRLAKYRSEAEVTPNGYGVAYIEWDTGRAVCYPIPLNLVVGILRDVLHRLKRGYRHDLESSAMRATWQHYEIGYKNGYVQGLLDGAPTNRKINAR